MIIYSVMPMELIMEQQKQDEQTHYQEVEVGGIKMLVQPSEGASEAKIVRLLSTNPQDFLNPSFMPGQTIYFRPDTRR